MNGTAGEMTIVLYPCLTSGHRLAICIEAKFPLYYPFCPIGEKPAFSMVFFSFQYLPLSDIASDYMLQYYLKDPRDVFRFLRFAVSRAPYRLPPHHVFALPTIADGLWNMFMEYGKYVYLKVV
jgi:hypothetical protein